MCTTYLEQFYNKHMKQVIPDWETYDKYASKEEYVKIELPRMKDQLKSLVLQQHLQWVAWSIVMMKGSLIDPKTNELWSEESKLVEMVKELDLFYIPYAKLRLDMYFEHRRQLLPDSPTKLL